MDCIITVDIGTTATKVVVFDMTGKEIASQKGAYPTFHRHTDISEQDPEQLFITVLFMLKSIINNHLISSSRKVRAIVFSSSMHCVLPVDKNGNPLTNAMIWSDNRAASIAGELKTTELGHDIYVKTGTPIHAMSPLAKIKWLRQNNAAVFNNTAKFISLKEYIVHQFTDEYVVDYSLASATGFFNLQTKDWEPQSLEYAGVTKDQFSKPVPIDFDELKFKKSFLKSLNLDSSTKLIIGSTDGCFASISSGSMQKEDAIISVSSGGAVRVFGKDCLSNKKGTFFNYILNDNYYISGGPTSNGGLAFEWAVNNIYINKGEDIDAILSQLFNELQKVKSGANGLLFLPYLQGERAPIWDSNARAMFFGLNITHQPIHMVRAAVEGIIFELYSIAKSILEHKRFNALHINGTYSTTPLWSQIICDVFGLPVYVSQYPNSSNLGAAMLALTNLGEFKSLQESSAIIPMPLELNPSLSKHQTYQNLYAIFDSLTHKLEEEFRLISEIQTKIV